MLPTIRPGKFIEIILVFIMIREWNWQGKFK
jgi:hypothetical protein